MIARVLTSADGCEGGAVRADVVAVAAVLHVAHGPLRNRGRRFGRQEGGRGRQGDVRGALCPIGLLGVALPAAALLPWFDQLDQSFGSRPLAFPDNDNVRVLKMHWAQQEKPFGTSVTSLAQGRKTCTGP